MLVPTERSSAMLVMIRSKSVSICNRSHARLKLQCLRGTPFWCPRWRGISSLSGTKFGRNKQRLYAVTQ